MERQLVDSLLEDEGPNPTGVPEEDVVEPAKLVRVRIGDSYHEVDQAVADTLESERRKRDDDYFRKISEQGARIKELSDEITRYKPAPVEDDDEEADTAFYKAPTKALKNVLADREKRLKDEIAAELRKEYSVAESQKNYTTAFYNKNPHLVGREDLVAKVYGDNVEGLKGLSWEKQFEKLAEFVDNTTQKWMGSVIPRGESPDRKVVSTKTVVSERGTVKQSPAPKTVATNDDDDDLSSFLKAERLRTRRIRTL